MKRRNSAVAATLLATVGSVVVLALTALGVFVIKIFGALSALDCQTCYDFSMFDLAINVAGVAGIFLAILTFWAIFTAMRPRANEKPKKR